MLGFVLKSIQILLALVQSRGPFLSLFQFFFVQTWLKITGD